MMVWMTYNTWQEALLSTILGVLATSVFLVMIRFVFQDMFPYLVHVFPFNYMGVTDTIVMSQEQQDESRVIEERLERIQKADWY